MMDDISLDAICAIFGQLEPEPEIVQRLDRWGCRYESQKAHALDWFSSQATLGGGAYSRDRPNTSARACYNRLLNPGMLIWIAAALGADDETIERATNAAIDAERVNYRKRCGAFRAVISFDDVLDMIRQPERWRLDKP